MTFLILVLTFLFASFLLVGTGIVFLTKNNNRFIKFSMGLAFSIMIMMAFFDLIPEVYETFNLFYSENKSIVLLVLYALIGFGILRILDLFIPHHHEMDEHEEKEVYHEHFFHIGIISAIALIIHNLIEGMALFQLLKTSITSGLFFGLGVGLHNIPLGMMISSAFYNKNNNKKKTFLMVLSICSFTFLGAILMSLASNFISSLVIGVFLCLTLGMIIYITILELLPHIWLKEDRKYSILGVISGIVIFLLFMLIH